MSGPTEPTPTEAVSRAPASAARLRQLADAPIATNTAGWATERHRLDGVGTSTYRTRAIGPAGSGELLAGAALIQFGAAGLESQPWYGAFLGGSITGPLPFDQLDLNAAHTSIGRFSITGRIERTYHQVQTLSEHPEGGFVITLRSIDPPTDGPRTARTLDPSGEVLTVDADGRLVWDHIVTAPGAALLPGRLDGWVTEATRRCGLDKAERATYEAEATEWIALLADTKAVQALAAEALGILSDEFDGMMDPWISYQPGGQRE